MSKRTKKRSKSRFKRFLAGIVVLILIATGLTAIGPTLVNWGLGQGMLKSAIEGSVNGSVEFGKLNLGWFGPQNVDGLTIVGSDGEKALDLDIHINAGLYDILLSKVEHLVVDITGSLSGKLRQDGTTTFQDIIKKDKQEDEQKAADASEESKAFAGLGRTTIRFDKITVEIDGDGNETAQSLLVSDLTGALAYTPGGEITINAQGKTISQGTAGSISIEGTIGNLIDASGAITLVNTSANIQAEFANIILPISDQQTQLQSATFKLNTENLAKQVDLSFVVNATIDSADAGILTGQLSAVNIVASDGSFDVGLDRITGSVQGKSVPTTLVQLLLEGTPILATRDIGPTVDVQAEFSASQSKDVSIVIKSKRFNAEFNATVNPTDRSIVGKRFIATTLLHPDLLKDIADIEVENSIPVHMAINEFSMDSDSDGKLGFKSLAAKGVIATQAPVELTIPSSGLGKQKFENIRIKFNTDSIAEGLQIAAFAGDNEVKLNVTRSAETISIDKAIAVVKLTPQMVSAFQGDASDVIRLTAPTNISVDITPFAIIYDDKLGRYALNGESIIANITAEEALFDNIPALVEPVSLRNVKAKITSNIANNNYAVKGSAIVIRSAHNQTLSRLNYDINTQLTDGAISGDGALTLRNLQLIYLERMMGAGKGSISKWLGSKGEITASINHASSESATKFTANFPYINGIFTASLVDDIIQIDAESATLTLQKAAVEASVNTQPTGNDAVKVFTVANDVPLSLEISKLRFPIAMLQSKAFDPTAVDLDLTLSGGPLEMTDAQGNNSGINEMKINITSDDLANSILFTLTETTQGDSSRAGDISLEGKITNLVSENNILQFDQQKLNLKGVVNDVPTHVVDTLLGLDGMLVAAVGPIMSSNFTTVNFSPDAGAIRGEITTTNGSLKGRIVGKDNGLILPNTTPLEGELQITPPLSQILLAKIHPILADIRSTEQPLRISAWQAFLPLDNDISKLKAIIEITVGKVELDSGSVTLGLLNLLNTSNAETIPGYIEPIKAIIRKGIVTYDRFEVVIGKYRLAYSGKIDLNTQMADLRTELPMAALAINNKDLEKYMDKIVVPLVTRGKLGDLKTKIDPDFDLAGAAAEAGLKGFLESELGGKGIDLGKIFDKILSEGNDGK